MKDAQSGQRERQDPLGVEAVSEETSEKFKNLLLVDDWSAHFSSNINDPTARTNQTTKPLPAWFIK